MFDAWHRHRWDHKGKYFKGTVKEPYEMLPHPIQMPHPPLYMAGGTDRSIGYCGRNGFGLMLSTLPSVETLAAQTALYKRELATASAERRKNPAAGEIDIARWVYIADTDAAGARRDRGGDRAPHLAFRRHRARAATSARSRRRAARSSTTTLATTLLHGSAETVIARLREMQARTGMTSLLLHYPPYYGREKTMKSLKTVRRARDPGLPPAGAAGRGGVTARKQGDNALGALFTVLATLCYAGMDAISKFLVADYAVGQIMWVRCALIFLFSWVIVRRQGLVGALRSTAAVAADHPFADPADRKRDLRARLPLPAARRRACLAATSPLIVIALGVLFLGEKAGLARWLAVAAGFAGVLLIIRPGLRTVDWPVLLPLVGAGAVGRPTRS